MSKQAKSRIPESQWEWFGRPAHFICGEWCRFHMATRIGSFLVSSVGRYVHPRNSGASESSDSAYLRKNPDGEEIGASRHYETLVFRGGKPCSAEGCNCGQPSIDGHELDSDVYNDVRSATLGHRKMCLLVASAKWQEDHRTAQP